MDAPRRTRWPQSARASPTSRSPTRSTTVASSWSRRNGPRPCSEKTFGSNEELQGSDLVDRAYEPPYPFVTGHEAAHHVRPGDFVTTGDGTGIVHLAPYGEDDIVMLRRDDLPVTQMIDPSGRVVPEGGEFAGLWVKDADPKIVDRPGRARSVVQGRGLPPRVPTLLALRHSAPLLPAQGLVHQDVTCPRQAHGL